MVSDISVEILEQEHDRSILPRNLLKLRIKGAEVNYILVNTIRRIAISLVPSYAFHYGDIVIEKNTSIFNNDYMRLRLANMPIIQKIGDIDQDVVLDLEADALAANNETRKDLMQIEVEKEKRRQELMENIHMYIEAKNTTSDVMNVTTADEFTKFYIKDKKVDNIYPRPVLVIKLKPNEEFKALCVASLHIHMKDNIFQPCSVVSFKQLDEHDFEFYLESHGQLTEKEVVTMACKVFLIKLEKIKEKLMVFLKESDKKGNSEVEITINNENHTMGNILTRAIQDHPNTMFCGYMIDNPFESKVKMLIKVKDMKITQVISECTDKLSKVIDKLIKQLDKL